MQKAAYLNRLQPSATFQVRDARNKVMHSASMTISQTEFTDFTDAMVDLLEDPGTLVKSKDAQEATRNIRKVR